MHASRILAQQAAIAHRRFREKKYFQGYSKDNKIFAYNYKGNNKKCN